MLMLRLNIDINSQDSKFFNFNPYSNDWCKFIVLLFQLFVLIDSLNINSLKSVINL